MNCLPLSRSSGLRLKRGSSSACCWARGSGNEQQGLNAHSSSKYQNMSDNFELFGDDGADQKEYQEMMAKKKAEADAAKAAAAPKKEKKKEVLKSAVVLEVKPADSEVRPSIPSTSPSPPLLSHPYPFHRLTWMLSLARSVRSPSTASRSTSFPPSTRPPLVLSCS